MSVPVDKILTLEMTNAVTTVKSKDQNIGEKNFFSKTFIQGLEFKHIEDDYVDFNREHLIPHSLSAEGPPLATGDVNGDGLEDIFVGGAKGQSARIFIQQKSGTFKQANVPAFNEAHFADDVDAAFFDADGDGDNDLDIVRGGNEITAGNPLLMDLLLINNGKGSFTKSGKGSLPYMSHNGSCVIPCDFDNDGDQDLFIGSRSVPGAYGLSPDQFLLENDGHGHFKDVTSQRSGNLKKAGMVTDAEWVDYDHDGDQDLVLSGEWMKLSIFRNDSGQFTEVTKEAGLDETSGWWYCVKAADVDKDGDMDLIAGNLGLNSMLKASSGEPVEMYLNDFDNNGSVDQVICYWQNGRSYPVASLDELASQIGGLEKQYPNYSDFGGKTAEDIFGENLLQQSIIKKAVLFESCIFLNNGDGTFKVKKLPVEAQFSPVRDILVRDINEDEKPDLILAGNDYAVRPSLGRYDASFGWCLLADPSDCFKVLMPVQSGLKIKGDARKIRQIEIAGKPFLVAAVNNGELQVFNMLK
jgi:hypothetical protein